MASWMASYCLDSAVDRDSSFYWQMIEGIMPPDEGSSSQYQNNHDLFRQFIDFDDEIATTTASFDEINGGNTAATSLSDTILFDPSPCQVERPTTSSAVSSADELDFPSASSLDFVDPLSDIPTFNGAQQVYHSAKHSSSSALSDLALQRLEQVSIHSPVKMEPPPAASHPSASSATLQSNSPTKKQPNKIVEAISATIKKATTLRRGRKPAQAPVDRSASPTLEHPPMAIKERRRRKGGAVESNEASYQAAAQYNSNNNNNNSQPPNTGDGFIHGYCEDPFSDFLQTNAASDVRYYGQNGIGDATSMLSLGNGRRVKSEQELYQTAHSASPKTDIAPDGTAAAHMVAGSWQQQQQQQQIISTSLIPEQQWTGPAGQAYMLGQDGGWWEGINVFSEAKNANLMHQAMAPPHAELPYDYEYPPPGLDAALMIQMSQPALMADRTPLPQTYLPPPPPIIPAAERERSNRPPKARSSGTRHRNMSPSPMRKTRGPSASPQPALQSQSQCQSRSQSQSQASTHQRRHSSAGSISSARSASARGANGTSAPGTPGGGGVRKRRSRDANLLSNGGGGGGGGGGVGAVGGSGGENIGFVNFTPSDGNILMTGVAPSGSSKTKARREKEAQERRRKLSEAAMKAVVAAGGDVDKLIQEGFVF